MKVSVVVPVLYEEPQLRLTLQRLRQATAGMDVEVLVVIDVPDPSREPALRERNDAVARETGALTRYRVGQRGFGSALRWAFDQAAGEAVIPFMGDLSDDPRDIAAIVALLDRGFDVVAGSRYMRGGAIVGNTTKQRVSRLYSMLMRAVGGPPIHDVSNAFKGYRRRALESVTSEASSFDVSVELTVKAHAAGFRVGEVPTTWTNRQEGQSNFNVRQELRAYATWLLYALRHRPSPGHARGPGRGDSTI